MEKRNKQPPHQNHGPVSSGFGPFVIERRIAVGGSAEVFLARPKAGTQPAPKLVVKRLLPEVRKNDDFDVLAHEAALHRAVEHPNVVTVYGAGVVEGEPYLAMEYVEGVDLYRLLRRSGSEGRRIPAGLAVYVCRRVADALAAVHRACDGEGNPLHIVHRDVTPSNIYLSKLGEVKLGDFGIARTQNHRRATTSAGLKGKFGYVAPEQIAGEQFDHRADLFSLMAILGEMIIGQRIFPGSGQLAVLLAIRDVDLEPMHRSRDLFPPGLLRVCERGLARDLNQRYAHAEELSRALQQFEVPGEPQLKAMLAEWVRWAFDSSSLALQLQGQIRDSVERMRAVKRALSGEILAPAGSGGSDDELVARPIPEPAHSNVRRQDGTILRDLTLASLIEKIAVGELDRHDEVALMGSEYQRLAEIPELARHLLPSTTATTSQLFEPGVPDYQVQLDETPMLKVLAKMRQAGETGAMFVQRQDRKRAYKKEIYLKRGRLLHVASTEREELLGEYLVRRGRIERAQLELALSSLSSYGGRLGDTLIGLGLVEAMDVFRAIRDQGRDRVAALCRWPTGTLTFYRNTAPTQVLFPLDLDLSSTMMAGVIVAARGDPRSLLPSDATKLRFGPRGEAARSTRERGSSPASLLFMADLVEGQLTLGEVLAQIVTHRPPSGRKISPLEACAAICTAKWLGWVDY